jgi:hypothetical protein
LFKKIQKISGVPYPAEFDLPTSWSDTTFKLSWRVNCSRNAPIINYKLEFRELPYGDWVVINIPAESTIVEESNNNKNHHQKRRKHGRRGGSIVEYIQSYTIRGLTKGSRYQVYKFA